MPRFGGSAERVEAAVVNIVRSTVSRLDRCEITPSGSCQSDLAYDPCPLIREERW